MTRMIRVHLAVAALSGFFACVAASGGHYGWLLVFVLHLAVNLKLGVKQ